MKSIPGYSYTIQFKTVLILVLILTSGSLSAVERKSRILVLHSYHQGLEWTDNISAGIQEVFYDKKVQYELSYEYLDTKRNYSIDYSRQLIRYLNAKNESIHYDMVIVTDNNALNFIRSEGKMLYPDTPVVFCGINNYSPELIRGMEHVTGVAEKTDYARTLEIMRDLHPDKSKVLVILDRTVTGDEIYRELKGVEQNFHDAFSFEYYRDFVIGDLQDDIRKLTDEYLIYILTFNRDRNDDFISYEEAIQILAWETDIPIYGSWDFYFSKGIVGGAITSGFKQGNLAGKMALDILQGTPVSQIPVIEDCPAELMFDYPWMKRAGISLTELPLGSVVLNQPEDFYDRFKDYILIVLGIMIVLTLGKTVLLLDRLRKQKLLEDMNRQLSESVEERTKEIARKNEELRKLVTVDRLTGVLNRARIEEILNQELIRTERFKRPLTVMKIGIDGIDKVNEERGHRGGDRVIASVAGILRENLRQTDFVGRWKGDCFLAVICETALEQGLTLAQTLRALISEHRPPGWDGTTVSIAVVSAEEAVDEKDLLKRLDEALRRAKSMGKNRVESSVAPP